MKRTPKLVLTSFASASTLFFAILIAPVYGQNTTVVHRMKSLQAESMNETLKTVTLPSVLSDARRSSSPPYLERIRTPSALHMNEGAPIIICDVKNHDLCLHNGGSPSGSAVWMRQLPNQQEQTAVRNVAWPGSIWKLSYQGFNLGPVHGREYAVVSLEREAGDHWLYMDSYRNEAYGLTWPSDEKILGVGPDCPHGCYYGGDDSSWLWLFEAAGVAAFRMRVSRGDEEGQYVDTGAGGRWESTEIHWQSARFVIFRIINQPAAPPVMMPVASIADINPTRHYQIRPAGRHPHTSLAVRHGAFDLKFEDRPDPQNAEHDFLSVWPEALWKIYNDYDDHFVIESVFFEDSPPRLLHVRDDYHATVHLQQTPPNPGSRWHIQLLSEDLWVNDQPTFTIRPSQRHTNRYLHIYRDAWVGAYWERDEGSTFHIDVYN